MPRGPVVYAPPPGTEPKSPGDVIQSATWNAYVQDVTSTFNTIQPEAYGGTGASTIAQARTNLGAAAVGDIRGYIYGLTLSNNETDAVNDINIAAGVATDTTNVASILLVSPLTKRLDAMWAAGTNQGGRDTGAIADGTWHVYLIRRPDTGDADVLFSAGLSPTMPANYTQFRRIGSIIREGGSIVQFWQNGDSFERTVIVDRNSTSGTVAAALTLSVPAGIVTQPQLALSISVGANSDAYMQVGSFSAGTGNVRTIVRSQTGAGDSGRASGVINNGVYTNTSRQIYFAQIATGGTITSATVFTYGWIDDRGRLA